MKIIKSSTSEISFLVNLLEASVQEQDFILITDTRNTIQEQYLAQVDKIIQSKEGEIRGTAIILGKIDPDNHSLSQCKFPISPMGQIEHPPKGLVSKIISYRGKQGIYLGDVITSSEKTDRFLISPDFLERHVLCVASTGAGKSYSVGVLLEEILLKFKSAAVLLFDIHNEYWGLAQPNDGQEANLLAHEEYSPQGFQNNILIFDKDSLGLGYRFDLPKLRRLLDLTAAQENSLMNIIKIPVSLDEIIPLIEESNIHSATRENLVAKIYSLKNVNLFNKSLDLEALICSGQVSIIRLDQFVDERKRTLLVNEILTQVFDNKTRGKLEREHEVVLVIEEAHRFASTSGILARIAREGRKFGIYEILISQRPGDLPDNIIANMNTLIALRIRSDKDLTKIRLMEGISTDTVSILPHLAQGEALIVGLQGGTRHPIKIRVRPRLSKHIDPQEDQMPEKIPRYRELLTHKDQDPKEIEEDEFVSDYDMKLDLSLEVKPFSHKDLTNLLACKHILLVHKNTGLCIFELGTTMFTIDPQLVSGFLSAISGLFSELKSQNLVKGRTIVRIFTEEIGDRAFKIITVEGAHSITTIILDRTPKYLNRFKQRMREFVYAFETEFNTQLEEFMGVLDHFTTATRLLDHYLGLSMSSPLQINNSYTGEITHPIIYEIINKQMDQLASFEGLFVEEIVNQCLLDSDYSYREIMTTLIKFFKEGILIPKNPSRQMPPFITQPLLTSLVEEQPQDQEITELMKTEEITYGEDLIDKTKEVTLETIAPELEKEDITWFNEILAEIQPKPLPDSLKEDIIKRDLIFESSFRIKANTIRIETYKESELKLWANLMTKNGFVMDKKIRNPLNGMKIVLRADSIKIVSSIALLKNGDYIIIFGEVT
ncbi:MAG: ATP-binding protein [Candidatus Hodarchaeota archaeon]